MEKYIKYKRIVEKIIDDKFQEFFDMLITEGWEIIHYNEKSSSYTDITYHTNPTHTTTTITVVVGKKQSNVL